MMSTAEKSGIRTARSLAHFFNVWRPNLTQEVDDDDRVAGAVLTAFAVVWLVEQEGGHVGSEDSRVDHQHQDYPVPQGLEG